MAAKATAAKATAAKAGARMLTMTYGKQSDDVYRFHNITATPTVHVHDAAGGLVATDVIHEPSDLPKLANVLDMVANEREDPVAA